MAEPSRQSRQASSRAAQESQRDRSVERSLRAARAKAESRSDRFIKSAIAILSETGRTDFTVQEVVERSRTSLRAFYQHFATKDELLLALFDEIMAQSTRTYRDETADLDGAAALMLLIERISAEPKSSKQRSINRALSLYNQHLAETRPAEHARVLLPLHDLIRDILRRGIAERIFRPGIDEEAMATIVMHTVLGAARLRTLGAELHGAPLERAQLFDFCMSGVGRPAKKLTRT
jgi:AcrR family transcriptional regulator